MNRLSKPVSCSSVSRFCAESVRHPFLSSNFMSSEVSETTPPEPDSDPAPDLGFDIESPVTPREDDVYATSLDNAVSAAKCADEMRAKDIVVLDLTALTSIVDFFVIATATNQRQMHAIADEVNRLLKRDRGNARLNVEGYRTEGNWLLTDYGDVVVHVFTAPGRELYDLEQLWADAPRIEWNPAIDEAAAPGADSTT
jgi:ribosome-associated protein